MITKENETSGIAIEEPIGIDRLHRDDATPSIELAPQRRRRGFAAMSPERVSEIAGMGGRAAHVAGTAHRFSSDEARVAGKKGGLAPHARRGRQRAAT